MQALDAMEHLAEVFNLMLTSAQMIVEKLTS